MVQGELFRDENSFSSLSGSDQTRKSFLSSHQVVITIDKLLLIFMAFVIMFGLTYSFGVERGKRAIEKNFESLLPNHTDTVSLNLGSENTAQTPASRGTVILVNQSSAPVSRSISAGATPVDWSQTPSQDLGRTMPEIEMKPVSAAAFPTVDLTKKGSYTIQLVTYADEKQAIREISLLKSKGHEGFVIPSGRYYQVCANYFENKAKARSFLKQFSELNRYPDAYIRSVVR